MIAKVLGDGSVAYYWNAKSADTKAGFTIQREALGKDYAAAIYAPTSSTCILMLGARGAARSKR
jgi:hypothetical protein